MRIYLDNCCFNRPYDDQSQPRIRLETEAKLEIQERIRIGEVELVWSYIIDLENAANPFAERSEGIRRWRGKASMMITESNELIGLAEKVKNLVSDTKMRFMWPAPLSGIANIS